jgi:hypothetical protein
MLRKQPGQKLTLHVKKYWIPKQKWWCVDVSDDMAVTTNCAIESFHARLNAQIEQDHPPLCDLQNILFLIDTYKFHCYELDDENKEDVDHEKAATRQLGRINLLLPLKSRLGRRLLSKSSLHKQQTLTY